MVDTLSLIVSILCAVGSFISFLLAQKEKKEAKESERQTQIYAENANQANLATKKLYDELSKYIQHQHVIDRLTGRCETGRGHQCLAGINEWRCYSR